LVLYLSWRIPQRPHSSLTVTGEIESIAVQWFFSLSPPDDLLAFPVTFVWWEGGTQIYGSSTIEFHSFWVILPIIFVLVTFLALPLVRFCWIVMISRLPLGSSGENIGFSEKIFFHISLYGSSTFSTVGTTRTLVLQVPKKPVYLLGYCLQIS
jgi:hypothetical protein